MSARWCILHHYHVIQSCFGFDFHLKHDWLYFVLHTRKVGHEQLNFFKLQMDVYTTSERPSWHLRCMKKATEGVNSQYLLQEMKWSTAPGSLSIRTTDILSQIILCGGGLPESTVGYLAASLTSTHSMPMPHSHPAVTTRNVSRHCHMSERAQHCHPFHTHTPHPVDHWAIAKHKW